MQQHQGAVLGEPRTGSTARRQLDRVLGVAVAADVLALTMAVAIGLWLKFGLPPRSNEIDWITGLWVVDFGWIVPVWMVSLLLQDVYTSRRFAGGADEFKALLKASLNAAAAAAMLAYLLNHDMSRGYFVYAFISGTILLLLQRFVLSSVVGRMRRTGRLQHRLVAVGSADSVTELERELREKPALGYQLVGVCLTGGVAHPRWPLVAGGPAEVVAASKRLDADTLIVLSGTFNSSRDLRRIGWQLQDSSIDLIVMPSLVDVAGPRIRMRPMSGLPLLFVEPPQANRALRWGKAWFDRVGASALLLVLSPLLAAIAVAVLLDSHGPAMFRHRRVGLNGKEFSLWKFRSMGIEAEQQQEDLILSSGQGALLFKLEDDPRVTRVGRFLRKYSLDELPQLINVLRGEMSLVGPRPQVAAEVAAYEEDSYRRLLVRPGMTGLWQVSGRSRLTLDEAIRLDLYYVDNWSMAGDLVILARTVRAVLRHDGAY